MTHMSNEYPADLLETKDLVVEFKARRKTAFRAVDGVDIKVGVGETLGLVGESGSGKTTIANAILGLVQPTEGTITFEGEDITQAGYRDRRRLSAGLQAVFQDPYSQLNPTRTIGETLAEPVRVHHKIGRAELSRQVAEMLEAVGLNAAAAERYPAQFSGGQRQRIAIARALMVKPKLVVCDEPTSALDLSVQAQVLNLLSDLQERTRVGYLLVSHDLAVVRLTADRVVVLYRGQVMEEGPADVVCATPLHPYSQMLLDAVPVPDVEVQRQRRIERAAPTKPPSLPLADAGTGCPFAARCVHATEICHTERPPRDVPDSGGVVACHHWRQIAHDQVHVAQEQAHADSPRAPEARSVHT